MCKFVATQLCYIRVLCVFFTDRYYSKIKILPRAQDKDAHTTSYEVIALNATMKLHEGRTGWFLDDCHGNRHDDRYIIQLRSRGWKVTTGLVSKVDGLPMNFLVS
jgi:hypothetical protein